MKNFPKIEKRIGEKFGEKIVGAAKQVFIFRSVIIMINTSLLFGLLIIYLYSFFRTSSSFLLGLSIFIGVLFVKSVLSMVALHTALSGVGAFSLMAALQNMFETIALVILFYLSME